MDDLISRESVIKTIKDYFKTVIDKSNDNEIDPKILEYNKYLNQAMKQIPTAYDVDKVVEQINTLIDKNNNPIRTGCEGMQCLSGDCIECMLLHTIEIVKGAVKDE